MKKYENLTHTGDIKIRAYGKDINEVFAHAAYAMFDNLLGKSWPEGEEKVVHEVSLESQDAGGLLVDFLNELNYLSDLGNEVYNEFEVRIEGSKLKAKIKGFKVERFHIEIKAVTYNELRLEKQNNLWIAEVVFDI